MKTTNTNNEIEMAMQILKKAIQDKTAEKKEAYLPDTPMCFVFDTQADSKMADLERVQNFLNEDI